MNQPPTAAASAVASNNEATAAAAARAQALFEQALSVLKATEAPADPAALRSLFLAAYDAHVAAFGLRDLRTARVGWQLASVRLSQGDAAGAEPLLLEVRTTREQLSGNGGSGGAASAAISDDLYDVYADLAAVHLLLAANSPRRLERYDLAMDLALKARRIVSVNANNSTAERFHTRMALISSRIGGIHRARGEQREARECFERAHDTASRLQMDLPQNVTMHAHACIELAADIAAEQLQTTRLAAAAATKEKSTRKASMDPTNDASSAMAASAANSVSVDAGKPVSSVPSSATTRRRNAGDLYEKAISALQDHALADLPLMAHAQAGLALHLMAQAEALHQQMMNSVSAPQPSPSPSLPAPSDPPLTSSSTGTPNATHEATAAHIQSLLHRAVQLTTEAMSRYQKIGGDNSPDVATMCYNLGGLHVRLGEVSTARPFLSRALRIRTRLYGLAHESVSKIRDELASIEQQDAETTPKDKGKANTNAVSKRSSAPTQGSAPLSGRKSRNLVPATARQHLTATPPLPPSAATTAPSIAIPQRRTRTAPGSARGTAAVAVKSMKLEPTAAAPLKPSTPTSGPATAPLVRATSPANAVAASVSSLASETRSETLPPALSSSPPLQLVVAPSADPSLPSSTPTVASAPVVLRKTPSQAKLLTFAPTSTVAPTLDIPVATDPSASVPPPLPTSSPLPLADTDLVRPTSSSNGVAPPVVERTRASIVIRRSTAPPSPLASTKPVVALPTGVSAVAPPTSVLTAAAAATSRPPSAKIIIIQRSSSKPSLLTPANAAATAAPVSATTSVPPVETNQIALSAGASTPIVTTTVPSIRSSSGKYILQIRPKSAVRVVATPAASTTIAETSSPCTVETSTVVASLPPPAETSSGHVNIDGAMVDARFLSF